jgi:glycosyltransferase involved in cell wall biosynthesis
MTIILTCPSLQYPHGGIRVIIEWANHLANFHKVFLLVQNGPLKCDWKSVDVPVIRKPIPADCLIVCSPHGIEFMLSIYPFKRKFVFCQMLEHMFQPDYSEWSRVCHLFYSAPYTMFSISKWNMDYMNRIYDTYYIGNGINLIDFPISEKQKDFKTVVIESPEPGNPCKDVNRLALRVASRLQKEGYEIIGYGNTRPQMSFEFHVNPSLQKLNDLYERATILIKATKYDARSTAPIEAMTKGTVTARAIIQGDDDLIHGKNCLRCDYDEESLYKISKYLLTHEEETRFYADACRKYAKENTWEKVINQVNEILCRE